MTNARERFVQARLAETPLCGHRDVEAWLELQRSAQLPHLPLLPNVPIISQWQRIPGSDLLRLTDPQEAHKLLVKAATSVGHFGIEHTAPKMGDWKPFGQLLGTHVDGARIFVGYHAFVIIEVGHRLYIMRLIDGFERVVQGEGLVSRPFGLDMELTSRAVADVLLGEWNRRYAKADDARKILCDAVAKTVALERARAECDFDVAVAVSEDCTKIVHADDVVVVRESEQDGNTVYFFHTYFPRPFQQHKLRRGDVIARMTAGGVCGDLTPQKVGLAIQRLFMAEDDLKWPTGFHRNGTLVQLVHGDSTARVYVAHEKDVPEALRGNLGSGAVCSV